MSPADIEIEVDARPTIPVVIACFLIVIKRGLVIVIRSRLGGGCGLAVALVLRRTGSMNGDRSPCYDTDYATKLLNQRS